MALEAKVEEYIARDNSFYRDHYHHLVMLVMFLLLIFMIALGVLLYQLYSRPLPIFAAIAPDGKQMQLTSYDEPNLSAQTIVRWASKAATVAYTFDVANYKDKLKEMQPYFTADGWQGFLGSAQGAINDIVAKQLIANAIVSGTPVISNQGNLSNPNKPNEVNTWRVQIPYIVTFQSDTQRINRNYFLILTVVKVPTSVNAQGIGIDQFLMYSR